MQLIVYFFVVCNAVFSPLNADDKNVHQLQGDRSEYEDLVRMTTEILLCVYLLHCILEPNQGNIEEANKHRIG